MDVLKYAENRGFQQTVLTNGTLFDLDLVRCISKIQNLNIEVSLDGDEVACDYLKVDGVYKRILEGLEFLKIHNIPFLVKSTI